MINKLLVSATTKAIAEILTESNVPFEFRDDEETKLFDEIWGVDCFSDLGSLNVHIRWLREKLEDDPRNPKLIRTVWRVGYQFGGAEN